MTHICVGKLTIIGSDNGLSPGRRQAIIWTNAWILLIGPLGTIFSEISIAIEAFSFKKMHLKISSAKWRPFCLGLNVLKIILATNNEAYDNDICRLFRDCALPQIYFRSRYLTPHPFSSHWDVSSIYALLKIAISIHKRVIKHSYLITPLRWCCFLHNLLSFRCVADVSFIWGMCTRGGHIGHA